MSVLEVMSDRILELGEGEVAADLEALVVRLRDPDAVRSEQRLFVAIQGHRLGRDPAVVALLGQVGMVPSGLFQDATDLVHELDEWSAFQEESMGLDRDLFSSSPFDVERRHWNHFLDDRRAWRCGYDPKTSETLVLLAEGTFTILMDAMHKWSAKPATLADLLRLTRPVED